MLAAPHAAEDTKVSQTLKTLPAPTLRRRLFAVGLEAPGRRSAHLHALQPEALRDVVQAAANALLGLGRRPLGAAHSHDHLRPVGARRHLRGAADVHLAVGSLGRRWGERAAEARQRLSAWEQIVLPAPVSPGKQFHKHPRLRGLLQRHSDGSLVVRSNSEPTAAEGVQAPQGWRGRRGAKDVGIGLAVEEPLWRTRVTVCRGFCLVSVTSCWLSAALWFLICLSCGLGKPEGGFYAATLSVSSPFHAVCLPRPATRRAYLGSFLRGRDGSFYPHLLRLCDCPNFVFTFVWLYYSTCAVDPTAP